MIKYYLMYLILCFVLSSIFVKVTINGEEAKGFLTKIFAGFLITITIGNMVGLPIFGIISLFIG